MGGMVFAIVNRSRDDASLLMTTRQDRNLPSRRPTFATAAGRDSPQNSNPVKETEHAI
jgi:hypothetical protein